MRSVIIILSVILASCSVLAENRTVIANETNGALVWPHAADFRATNDISSITALTATSTADRAYSDTLNSNTVAALTASNAAQDVVMAGKVATNDPVHLLALTNGTGNGATVTVTGRQFHVYVSVPTGSAASVQANLDLHSDPTNTAAHNVTNVTGLIDLLAGKAGTNDIPDFATNASFLVVSNQAAAAYPSSNPSNYVTAAVTNGAEIGSHASLATYSALSATSATDRAYAAGLTNGFVDATITNGLGGVSANTVTNSLDLSIAPSLTGTVSKAASALQAEADTINSVLLRGKTATVHVTNSLTIGPLTDYLSSRPITFLCPSNFPTAYHAVYSYLYTEWYPSFPNGPYFFRATIYTEGDGPTSAYMLYDSGNFQAGTHYLAPNGSGASLTGFTPAQIAAAGGLTNIPAVLTPVTLIPDAGGTATVENVFAYNLGSLTQNVTVVIGNSMTNTAQMRGFWLDFNAMEFSITFPTASFSNVTGAAVTASNAYHSYWSAGVGQTIFKGAWR